MTGIVFDIKEFALHDGPGPRTTVFLKGCPLRCQWCHNPEGLSPKPQLMVKKALCTGCGRCHIPCAHTECVGFDRCIHACPNGLISVAGRKMEAAELAAILNKDSRFFSENGGGITVSGGEPLMQPGFVIALCDALGDDIHKALETSGYADPKVFSAVASKFDLVLLDLKLADPEAHKRYTGRDNRLIHQNLRWLRENQRDFILRIPLIPGITDTRENLTALAEIAGSDPVELLAYNAMAGAKYPLVDMEYLLGTEKNAPVDLSIFQNARMG